MLPKKCNFWKHLLRICGVFWSISNPNYVQILIFVSKKAWSCRQIRLDPSKIASRIRTLFTALERCRARSVHYICIIREVLQCCIYSVRIAFECSTVSRVVCGSHLRFLEAPRGSQVRSTHYTRYISSIVCNPYTIYTTFAKKAKKSRSSAEHAKPIPFKSCYQFGFSC